MLSMAVAYVYGAESRDISAPYSIWKVVGSLLFIIAFIPLTLWLVKKFQLAQMKLSQSEIKVVSVQSLGTKEKLMLVEVEGERMLLGVTSQSINHLKSFSSNARTFATMMDEASSSETSSSSEEKKL